jgi:hypothetical protein
VRPGPAAASAELALAEGPGAHAHRGRGLLQLPQWGAGGSKATAVACCSAFNHQVEAVTGPLEEFDELPEEPKVQLGTVASTTRTPTSVESAMGMSLDGRQSSGGRLFFFDDEKEKDNEF